LKHSNRGVCCVARAGRGAGGACGPGCIGGGHLPDTNKLGRKQERVAVLQSSERSLPVLKKKKKYKEF
jgi:hypothetical protein